ncbi:MULTISPECIES: O-succinylhomoserine sulfhydrylase [unclassified Methylophaga]|jgi:O-succinylhomoserine sulfhydrylase|uniref:O-succinylhomoserine sulfhydrylase n=1 Tax=unclassified Methylophaga TaxID=2629249 RepID=UPI000C97B415|nr:MULTISPECIES: O-succinylhomoserine sulfhydrylase [unclassified Methylophaga]MAK66554.1 O-succinylhomoserine sulfhydrylase [Methylophaga sp.]MAY17568.1 O-succinylhomoserine sulfhydrylase [Methylophaga sp.]MBN47511.1 O-succinylhomoserine sulfhydrylase [Methylophaga sp.]HCD05702.1 O-succinylhomoserine sulfhydrylase [Methylophaga sp.]|tara:strand:+ start:2119 stop:3303 length:1185 start_codon:yes stop_codon:yes gene_type:complete
MTDLKDQGFATRAIRTGHVRTPEGEHSEPIFPTSSFVFDSAEQAAARFGGDEPGNIYARFTNPTVRTFEQRLASLEQGEACVATASGMSAILATFMGLCAAGDHIVSSRSVFGTTRVLFDKYLSKFGLQTDYVPLTDLAAWEAAIKPNTKALFLETPSNPLNEIADLAALSALAKQHDCLLIVDNCFCTPALQQPLLLGADIVIHSATKYIDGQGRCVGGAVVGDAQRVGEDVYGFLRSAGPTMSAFNAWTFLKGLETLDLRMRAHSSNANQLAHWLQQQKQVSQVFYAGLKSHPGHQLAKQQQSDFGGIIAFEVKGGQQAAWKLINATRFISITANLGDTKTTITHPATTTHGRLSEVARAESGISEGMIRLSVGLENVEDIQTDIQCGLDLL